MIAETVRRHCNQDCDGSLFCSRQWSALAARNLVELFDRIDRLSHAFLTGLESHWAVGRFGANRLLCI
jgi:hypothetical protein